MYLYNVVKHLERREKERGLCYRIFAPLADLTVNEVEECLHVVFPFQVREFYRHYGGIQIDAPLLEILPINRMAFFASQRLHFATVDGEHRLYFDTSHLNEAGQWDICTDASDARVTVTMASFWSNKIWAWVDKKRPIWLPGAVW